MLCEKYVTSPAPYFPSYQTLGDLTSVGQPQRLDLPTDERLGQFKQGETDPALAVLYYQFGRYLLISSSRPDNPLPSDSMRTQPSDDSRR